MNAPAPSLAHDRLVSAASWRLTFLAIQGGCGLVLFSVLSHVLGVRAFAATAVAQGVIVIAQAIGDFGLSQAAVTVLPARVAAGQGAAAELRAGAATAYLGATALGLGLTLVAAAVVPSAAAGPVAISSLGTAAAIVVSGADGILRSQGEFSRPVRLMAASELAGFAGIPVAAATGSAFWTCAAVALGMALGAVGAGVVLVKLRAAARGAPVRPFARASVPLGISQLFIALATRVDTLLAGVVSGLIAAGTFEGCWRIYQLSQYVAGGVASAAAPFVADAFGGGRLADGFRLLRGLLVRLLAVGLVGGLALLALRTPISDLLAGRLARHVAGALPALALVSPLQAVCLAAYFALIGQEGQRARVLAAIGAGAAVNLALAAALGSSLGARGVVIGCAVGQAVTALLLIGLLVVFVRQIAPGAETGGTAAARPPR